MRGTRYAAPALTALIGLTAIIEALELPVGSLDRMGPGFFPLALGILLVGLALGMFLLPEEADSGVPSTVRDRIRAGDLRAWLMIAASVIGFIILGRHAGLAPAIFVSVLISALSHRDNSLSSALHLSTAMMVIGVILFHYVLGISIPVIGF